MQVDWHIVKPAPRKSRQGGNVRQGKLPPVCDSVDEMSTPACLVAGGQGGRRAGAVVRGGDVAGQMRCGGGTPEAGHPHPAGGGPFTIAFTGYQTLTHRPAGRILNGLSRPSIRPSGLSASARKGSGKEGAGRSRAAGGSSTRVCQRAASFPHASVHYRPYRLSTQHLIAI